MKLLNLRWILLIGLLVGSVLAEDVSADRPAKKFSAADLFNLISNTSPLSIGKGWNDGLTPPERWKNQMKEMGLKFLTNERGNIADQTGELRVEAYFLSDKISFFIDFYPADLNPIPAPILTSLISKAESSSADLASALELRFPAVESSTDEHLVSKTTYMKIQLQRGILTSQSKLITCSVRK